MVDVHAPLAASSAPGWGSCSAYFMANADKVDKPTPESMLGDAGHWVVACALTHCKEVGLLATVSDWLGKTAPNGIVVDATVIEGAEIMFDEVIAVARSHSAVDRLLIEHKVYMPFVHPTDNWGTLDCALVLPELFLVYLWDYKGGHGAVGPESLQLSDYMIGLVNEFPELKSPKTRAVIRVVQPFSYSAEGPVKERKTLLANMRPEWNKLERMAWEAYNAPRATPGPQCRYCDAILRCPASRNMEFAFIDFLEMPYKIDTMSCDNLAVEREILKKALSLTTARLDAVNAELEHKIRNRETCETLTLQGSTGNLEFTVQSKQAIALCAAFGVDITKESIKTPTQAISAASKEMRPHLKKALEEITNRPNRGLKLTKRDGCRTALAFKKEEK